MKNQNATTHDEILRVESTKQNRQQAHQANNIQHSDKQASSDSMKWYVVHTNAGHEARVASTLQQRIEAMNLQSEIAEVLVPTKEKIVISDGKKRTVQERLFPGYILVKMILNDFNWHVVRNTSGVTGFVGTSNRPAPLPSKEVEAILKFMKMEAPKFEASFNVGDGVKITDGPFKDFLGKVDAIDNEKGKVKVLVSIFGRETPVELDFLQVSRL